MGILDKLRGEFIDIIAWTDDTSDTLVWRFPRHDNEIKYGAQLIVRESQAAALINEGKLADVFRPGTYSLQTQNIPILSTLKGWKYGFESPFKAEVYFVSTRTMTDRKWGTKNPIMMRDAEFGPIRLRAFGTYALRVSDPAAFLRQIAGTEARFTVDEIQDQLRDLVVARFADILASSKIPALDLAGNYDRIGRLIAAHIHHDFAAFGVEIVNLLVENISLPPEVEQAIDRKTSMGVVGNLQQYTQFQAANALTDAAENSSGLASAGAGIGLGYIMANQVGPTLAPNQPAPPIPAAPNFFLVLAGKQTGPFPLAMLAEKATAGQLTPQTLVWRHGMPKWEKACDVPELAPLFSDTPPAIPNP